MRELYLFSFTTNPEDVQIDQDFLLADLYK